MKFKLWNKYRHGPFTDKQLKGIAEATQRAEALTSGEIRVVLRDTCQNGLSSKQQVLADFQEFGLINTRDKTGVLILILLKNHQVEVLDDKGINDRVGEGYWDQIVSVITDGFNHNKPYEGICRAVEKVGGLLAETFPRKPDDTNELSDEPIVK